MDLWIGGVGFLIKNFSFYILGRGNAFLTSVYGRIGSSPLFK